LAGKGESNEERKQIADPVSGRKSVFHHYHDATKRPKGGNPRSSIARSAVTGRLSNATMMPP
jgi:hypothetical protein